MSQEEANVELLKEAYRQWNDTRGKSVDHWINICDPKISFGSIPRGREPMAFARDYDSREKLREYFKGVEAEWDMIDYTFDQFVAQGDIVFARGEMAWKNKRTGKEAQTPKVDFFRLRDGKIVEYYEYFDTARVAEAATQADK